MILLMFSMAWRICLQPAACSRTAVVTCSVDAFMSATVFSTSAEAFDWRAVEEAISAISWLDARDRVDDAAQREPGLVGEL